MQLTVVLAVGVDSLLIGNQRSALRSAGYILVQAGSIKEAIEHFRVGDFDLVLLGQSLSAETKEKFAFLVRSASSRTPVVCIAGPSGDCDAFADATLKCEQNRLITGIGELLARMPGTPAARAAPQPNLYPDNSKATATNLVNEDSAMHMNMNRQRVSHSDRYSSPDWNVQAAKRASVQQDLRHALERNEITLHYQPKFDLKTGEIIGAEALSRWIHPSRGSVSPSRFIPIAEECGLILPIGAWVLREACKQARSWVDAGLPARRVTVNISELQLQKENFCEELFAILNETGLDPGYLELDVTTSVLMKHLERTTSILRFAQNKGVQISADNLGAGYPNFGMLRRLPLNALKIDRSFVCKIASHPDDRIKVSAIINLGHRMNLRVIAEGVETVDDLDFLWEHSCDEAQGYYLGQPMPPEELPDRSGRKRFLTGVQ